MKKNMIVFVAIVCLLFALCACQSPMNLYSDSFFGSFDTIVSISAYARNPKSFADFKAQIESRMMELHRLFDIYHTYEGIHNVKTINDSAGIAPVVVDPVLLEMITLGKAYYATTKGTVNIAMGPVLRLWHDARAAYATSHKNAALPEQSALMKSQTLCSIDDVIIDPVASTIYLQKAGMSLDVGAIAKGFAVEVAAREYIAQAALSDFLISAGGNVLVQGAPQDGRRLHYGVGLQDPDVSQTSGSSEPIDVLFVNDTSVVTSGDYQRYMEVDGIRYSHIIDPSTLAPAREFRSVTVIAPNSALADLFSTALFILPYEQGRELILLQNFDAVWIMPDGTIRATDGAERVMRSHGATADEP